MRLSNRNTPILAVVAVGLSVLTVATYAVEWRRAAAFQRGTPLIQGLDLAKVATIRLLDPDAPADETDDADETGAAEAGGDGAGKVTLVREAGRFVVKQRAGYPAATKEVNDLLLKLLRIALADEVTDNPENYAELEVSGPAEGKPGKATRVILEDAEGAPLVTLYLGKSVAATGGKYIRLEGKPAVYATEEGIWVDTSPMNYIDSDLLSLDATKIETLLVKEADGTVFQIQRDKDDRAEIVGVPEGKRQKQSEVDGLLRACGQLSFSDVKAATDMPGFNPTRTLMLTVNQHLGYRIELQGGAETTFVRVQAKGPSAAALQVTRQEIETSNQEQLQKKNLAYEARDTADAFNKLHQGWIYELSDWKARSLAKPYDQLLEEKPDPDAPTEISARHILVAYKGADRSKATRTKEEAKARAEEVLTKAKAEGADFAKLAEEYSDGPSKTKGGDLGSFKKGAMAKNFEAAAFKLKVGEISGVVETPFGFHVIKRTE